MTVGINVSHEISMSSESVIELDSNTDKSVVGGNCLIICDHDVLVDVFSVTPVLSARVQGPLVLL